MERDQLQTAPWSGGLSAKPRNRFSWVEQVKRYLLGRSRNRPIVWTIEIRPMPERPHRFDEILERAVDGGAQ